MLIAHPGSSSTVERHPNDRECLLTVSDNGIGIAEEFTDKVFVIFQRLHGRDVYPGTGVGLALVKKIVEYHGGAVRIDTTYTEGTRFEFTLPVPARERRTPNHLARSPAMTPAGRAIEILLVEDDAGDELITREALKHNKFKNKLHVAHDGEEGLNFLYRRGKFQDVPRPDLILLDLNLPKYDGRQLLEKVKSDADLSASRSWCSPPLRLRKTSCAATSCTPMPMSPSRSTWTNSSAR